MSFGKTTSFRLWRGSLLAAAVLGFTLFLGASVRAQFTQNFDVVPAPGWTTQNNSTPVGTTGWFQGNSTVFPSQSGAGNSYIGANFNSTTGTNTISNWLISPQSNLANGNQLKFWTRTTTANPFPDRLQVRLSTAGASTNVGTGPTGTGDFTTLLIDINPDYNTGGGSPPANYPEVWTEVTLTLASIPGGASGRFGFRYFVELGGPTGDNSNYIGIDTVSFTTTAPPAANGPVDFDGDGKTDWTVVRNTGGGASGQVTWFYNLNAGGPTQARAWGLATDEFVSGNFDGDNNDDIACWRPGSAGTAAFYVLRSTNATAIVEPFGQTGDDPTILNDFTGDGKTDFAVYRPGAAAGQASTFYYRNSQTLGGPVTFLNWGQNGDFPLSGDFDGNGTGDVAVQRNAGGGQAAFWMRLSTGATSVQILGTPTDVVVPGDYDGDGKTDLATIRGSAGQIVWLWRPSGGGGDRFATWGASATDFPTQGDYDGDGKTDLAIWRAGAFWVYNSSNGATNTFTLGANGDYPVANFNAH